MQGSEFEFQTLYLDEQRQVKQELQNISVVYRRNTQKK